MGIIETRQNTLDEVMQNLNNHGLCAVIRPTGFGKTYMMAEIMKQYKKVLFLYPNYIIATTIQNRYNKEVNHVTFMTYSALIRKSQEELKEIIEDYDIIMCDELHRIGGDITYKAMRLLKKEAKGKTPILGATATPERSDSKDIVKLIFDNRTISDYNLHDAFTDGVIKKPYYFFCTYNVEEDLKEVGLEIKRCNNSEKREVSEVVKRKAFEISKLFGVDNVIRETCDSYLEDISYMKFIVFFSSIKEIKDDYDMVKGWFQKAYPSHNIEILVVSSSSKVEKENVKKIDSLVRKENTIQLIYCIDMLNMGYHVDNLTGIVMKRTTSSNIIFIQLGRALSTSSEGSSLVFDIADNLHRKSLYDIMVKKEKNKKGGILLKSAKAVERLKELQYKEEKGTLSEIESVELENLLNPPSYYNANDILAEDLVPVGNSATYREIIAKTVAEPISIRCRTAFKEWAAKKGADVNYLKKWVEDGKPPKMKDSVVDYLLSQNVPITAFARIKSVSIDAILDWLLEDADDVILSI